MARRIALVEDDPTIRQNYTDALTRAGYEVAAFADRPTASRTLAAQVRRHRGLSAAGTGSVGGVFLGFGAKLASTTLT